MEHSLHFYLDRLPTAKLEKLLLDIRSDRTSETYTYMIPIVEEILKKRMVNTWLTQGTVLCLEMKQRVIYESSLPEVVR